MNSRRLALIAGLFGSALTSAGCQRAHTTALNAAAPAMAQLWDAGAPVVWSWTGGSPHTDWITRVVETRDGGVVAVGFINRDDRAPQQAWDAVAMKFRHDGRLVWSRTFGGDSIDAFWDVREAANGQLLIAGFSASTGAGMLDAWLVALDPNGDLLHERRFGGRASDLALGLALAPDGGVLLVGQTESEGAGERDVLLIRTDASGVERWRRTYGGPNVDRGFYAARTNDGFVIAGVTGAADNYDMLTISVSDNGDERWRSVIGGPGNDPNHGLSVLADGRILVTGYAQSWDARVHDLVALTYAADGTLLRHEMMGAAGDDRVMSVTTAPDGGSWLFGYTRSFSGGDWDVLIARVRADGSFEPWLAALGTPHDDQAYTGLVTRGGALLLGGYTSAPSNGEQAPDLLLARLAPASLRRHSQDVKVRRIR